MRRAFGIALIAVTSPFLAMALGLLMLAARGVRALVAYRNRGPWARIKPSRSERQAFEGRLQEHEFRVANRGASVITQEVEHG